MTTSRLRAAFLFPLADRPPMMLDHLVASVEPVHANRPIFSHSVSASKQEDEIIQRPSSASRRDVLDREEMPPLSGQRGDKMRHDQQRMTAPNRHRIGAPRSAPKPHRHQPAIQKPARLGDHLRLPVMSDDCSQLAAVPLSSRLRIGFIPC